MPDGFDKVSVIVGEVMNNAWNEFVDKMAKTAKGEAPLGDLQALNKSNNSFTQDDLKDFFAKAGGANMSIFFPSVVPKVQSEICKASTYVHGVVSALDTEDFHAAGIDASLSVSMSVRF